MITLFGFLLVNKLAPGTGMFWILLLPILLDLTLISYVREKIKMLAFYRKVGKAVLEIILSLSEKAQSEG